MSGMRATFDPLRPHALDGEALRSMTLSLTRRSDREQREVTLTDAIRGIVDGGWELRWLGAFWSVKIGDAESELDGPLLARELLREYAEADEAKREALSLGDWYHAHRSGFPEDPIDEHGFFLAFGTEVRGTVSLADEWTGPLRITDVIKPRPVDAPDYYRFYRTLLVRQRFETETELGRLVALGRRVDELERLGVPATPDAVAHFTEIVAARRDAATHRLLRRLTWLLVAILAALAWIGWKLGG